MQFLLRLVNALSVLTIDDKDKALGTGVVVSPQRTNLVLSSHIPDIEFDILVRDGFNIESDWEQIR